MDDTLWEKYKNDFTIQAGRNGFNKEEIKSCLNYAAFLSKQQLPIIYDQQHLALLVGYKLSYLIKASNSTFLFYRTFTIKKKNGGSREIAEPLPSLKEIQKWILKEILEKLECSKYAKAYISGTSIKENARFHRGQEKVLTIDIKDFFSSIKFRKVFSLFKRLGYSKAVTTMLANLCCLDGSLPQGAPTSPALSNLIVMNIDKRIAGFSKKYGFRFTRYSDDLTFSGAIVAGSIINFVKNVLLSEKLSINDKKIRLMHAHQRQEVTGIVTNQKLQVSKLVRKKFRQEMYYIQKFGLDSHLQKIRNTRSHYLKHMLGIANFVSFVNPQDTSVLKSASILKRLLKPPLKN